MTLAERIDQLRRKRGLTHLALAQRCGVTLRVMQGWQAEKAPGRDHLQPLADALFAELPRRQRLAALFEDVVLNSEETPGHG